MARSVHLLTLLSVVAVPLVGWFAADWSAATTLLVYWFENVAACVFITARALIHRRWNPRRGHYRYAAPNTGRRGSQRSSFVSGFAVTSLAFCAAHAVFLGVILSVLDHNSSRISEIDWRSVQLGCAVVLVLIVVDFVVDLPTLRSWPFRQMEQTAQLGLGRVAVVHLTLIVGLAGIVMTDAPSALFGTFVVLKSLFTLSGALPQWEPATAPRWLSGVMNRIPRVQHGTSFDERWAQDRADEAARRGRNEQPWVVTSGQRS
ncbi:Uncharacterised protein [Mycolicibacterium vanbaalenii]|uniref:Uncharacterized protein n=1 Tax=Mycolicibacterium vanbaalenii TaxID=110539 RepID=A0A5S9R3Y0_MYCVN|nr:DUF6498-containing protein [Mycolicibacterium vanbaalenii]CAA0127074.1 Uncharacterised protein [Mycolicibacterium vanbaalenii]